MKAAFAHFNFNVLDLGRSLEFYSCALGLTQVRCVEKDSFTLVYLGDGVTDFQLELTHMHNRTEPYDLGESEFHLAFTVDDFDRWHALHEKLGCICYENKDMGIYFIEDPDGYWLEIIPDRR